VTLQTRIVINSLQLPADGLSVAEARAKAVQHIVEEPASSTPPEIEDGEETTSEQD